MRNIKKLFSVLFAFSVLALAGCAGRGGTGLEASASLTDCAGLNAHLGGPSGGPCSGYSTRPVVAHPVVPAYGARPAVFRPAPVYGVWHDHPSVIDGGCSAGTSVVLDHGRPVSCVQHTVEPAYLAQFRRKTSEICGGRHGRVDVPIEGHIAHYDCP